MHILQINTEKGWRGGERQTLLCSEGLRRAGHRVTLLCLAGKPLAQKAREAGFETVGVKSQFDALLHIMFSGRKYAALHAQSSRAFGFAALATLAVKKPLVYTRRTVFPFHGKLTKLKYMRASAVVAISSAAGRAVEQAGLQRPEIISSIVVPAAPDRERIAALKNRVLPFNARVVGVVAALTPEKNPVGMVDAAAMVCSRLENVVFFHCGDGVLRDDLLRRVSQANLQGQYIFAGFQDQVEELFGMFDVFAMASLAEGLGSSVLDAFAAGVPVASSDAGGLSELVHGRGLLSPTGNAKLLAENIITLLSDQKKAETYSSAAKRYVIENHGMEVLAEKYVALYRRVVKQ